MTKYSTLEWCPLQILSLEDLQVVVEEAIDSFSDREWGTKRAEREWRKLVGYVQGALDDAYMRGLAATDSWLQLVEEELQRVEDTASKRVKREVRLTYFDLLDRIYGGIFRHTLRRVPTCLPTQQGNFALGRITIFRCTRLRDTEKPALEQLLEFIYRGGPRFELEFGWRPMGDGHLPGLGEPKRR